MKKDININDDFDNAFKSAMERAEVELPENSWGKVDAELNNIENSRLKKRIVFWISTSLVLFSFVVGLGIFTFYLFNHNSSQQKSIIAQAPVIKHNGLTPEQKQITRNNKNEISSFKNNNENRNINNPAVQKQENVAVGQQLPSSVVSQNNSKQKNVKRTDFVLIKNKTGKVTINKKQDEVSSGYSETNINVMDSFALSANETKQEVYSIKDNTFEKETKNNEVVEINTNNLKPEIINDNILSTSANNNIKQDSVFVSPINIASNDSLKTVKTNIIKDTSIHKILPVNQEANSHFYVEGIFSPEISGQYMKDNNSSDEYSASYIKSHETNIISSSEGIRVGYDINKWSIQSGAVYYKQTFAIKPCSIYPDDTNPKNCDLVTSSGIVQIPYNNPKWSADSMVLKDNSFQTLSFLSVPIQLKYLLNSKRISFYAIGGILANILINAKTNVEIKGDKWTKDYSTNISGVNGTKSIYYGYSLGIGASYKFRKGIYISLEPQLRGAMSSLNKNTPVKTYPYTFGLGLILGYHL